MPSSRACISHIARPLRPIVFHTRTTIPFRVAYQPLFYSSSSNDPKLHPNPNASPSTDPSSPSPSANPNRADSPTSENAHGAGHASPAAQSNVDPKGPNMEQLPHVSEEAAAVSKTMGEGGPSVEQGTPVQEVLQKDEEAYHRLPKVMKDALNKKNNGQKRDFSTSTRRAVEAETGSGRSESDAELPPYMTQREGTLEESLDKVLKGLAEAEISAQELGLPDRSEQAYPGQYHEINEEEALLIAKGELADPVEAQAALQVREREERGLKFAPPTVPLDKQKHLQRRYDGAIEQVTNLIMKHGKKSVAQKHIAEILTYLRTAPSPKLSPPGTARRLLPLPGHTPSQQHLPLHPIFYLTFAIDSIAPLMRIRSQRGFAGGGVALQVPVPLSLRQRRRAAVMWILDAVERRKGATSRFPKRFAEEIVSIVEGRSSVWTKRENAHRLAMMGRSNLNIIQRRRR